MGNLQDKLQLLKDGATYNISVTNYDTRYEKIAYEKMHSKFLKFILGVNKWSSNTAVRGELGRFPISLKAISLCIKYWHNIACGNTPNCLLASAYLAIKQVNSVWFKSLEYIIKMCGMRYV